jgi:hypothetical protein
MSYVLTVGPLHVLSEGALREHEEKVTCHEARRSCSPSFVFSVGGQINFRSALKHVASCGESDCVALRRSLLKSSLHKLSWLMEEECLLGCVQIQPLLYGESKVKISRDDFPAIARHLAVCPKESCAQLRRSLLLTIRNEIRLSD